MKRKNYIARLQTRCTCGCWVSIGTEIVWDVDTKRTIGCVACNYTGENPDPEASYSGGLYPEDYDIFHD